MIRGGFPVVPGGCMTGPYCRLLSDSIRTSIRSAFRRTAAGRVEHGGNGLCTILCTTGSVIVYQGRLWSYWGQNESPSFRGA